MEEAKGLDDGIPASDDKLAQELGQTELKYAIMNSEAKQATNKQHSMSVAEAVKLYPKAIGWSILLSTAVAMEGYDIVLIASFYAFPPFNKKYGVQLPSGSYQVPAPWQAGLSNGARVGEILGLTINGIVSEQYGFKRTMIGALLAMIAFIFIPFFAQNIQTLEAGEILMGIPWGVFQTLTTAYAAEVCPLALRGYLTTYVNMMWGLGQLIASGVLRALLVRQNQWAYRIPYALQWMWPLPLVVAICFAPDSPWWLVRRGRSKDARRALKRLTTNETEEGLDQTLAMMEHTNNLEKEISTGTSYFDCFKGVDLRRTEITCITWAIQPLCGASLMGYSAYFFEQAGLGTYIAFDFSISLYSIAMIGVAISWFFMSRVGRRTLFLGGLCTLFIILIIIGFVSLAPAKDKAPKYAIGSLLLLFTLCYDITVGTVAYSIVAEIPSSRLRSKTIVLARSLYNVVGIVNGVITPYMLNPAAWNWKGKAGFFWAGICFLCIIWTFFRLPEPKGRTFGELDILFGRGITARKFKSTQVENLEIDVPPEKEAVQ